MKYNHKVIEPKWQEYWVEKKVFSAKMDHSKPKYYILDMFPYPSGAGLHVGHPLGYTATDIYARFKRQKGYNVLHPMGWDSFGLPAEQYAVRTGTHPRETTQKNIDNYRRQLQALGFSYDWEREFATSDPSYYKWTQWIFTELYKKGLAYEADLYVNYCPKLGTVLANEEVEAGRSKEGGYLVERRPLKQWVLKITAYAEQLLSDLDLLDWPEYLKKLQRNWIGKSEGAKVFFSIKGKEETIEVFTTRPDTLFGATYMVLAPEHPLVVNLTKEAQKEAVEAYQAKSALKSDLDRTELAKEKTGVFTGSYAINPVNDEEIPIWIADYVLIGYGTGAIMAVPAHDERDFAFATAFSLPIIPVFFPEIANHPELVGEEETPEEVEQKVIAGTHCWPGEGSCINSAHGSLSLNGLDVKAAKEKVTSWLKDNGKGAYCINYKLRDWLFSRQRYWGEPFPILHFEDGQKRVLDLDELPLIPPELSDYKPAGDAESPLTKVREWVEIIDPKTKKPALRETNTMPQWAGSCWYYLRFCDPHNPDQAWSKEAENYWMPVDLYVGGVEHAVLHLLYARFWHKVLYDCGFVHTKEPFQKLRNQGVLTAHAYKRPQGSYVAPEHVVEKEGDFYEKSSGEKLNRQVEKMSKSKLNGVTPDAVVEEFGADAFRLYEMFMGPLDREKIWNTDAISGSYRFLKRFWEIALSDKVCEQESEEALKLGHYLVHGVGQDLEGLQFNTAIAKMMTFINDFVKLPAYPRSVIKMAIQVLNPFAPHITEELWEKLGFKGELSYQPFPEADLSYLEQKTVTYVVQVNGKLRGRFELAKDEPEEVILEAAKKLDSIERHLDGKEIRKVVFVPNKLLNIVVA